jgi:hypothetical protein
VAGADADTLSTGGSTGVCSGPGPDPDVPPPPANVVEVVEVEVVDVVDVDVVDVEVVDVEVVVVDVVVVVELTGIGGGSGPPEPPPGGGGDAGVMPTAGSWVTGVARSALSEKVAVVVKVPEALEPMSTVTVTEVREDPGAREADVVHVHPSSVFPDE